MIFIAHQQGHRVTPSDVTPAPAHARRMGTLLIFGVCLPLLCVLTVLIGCRP